MNTVEEVEEWVLGQLEQDKPDVGSLLGRLTELSLSGQVEEAKTLAELAEKELRKKGLIDEALRVLRLRADWYPAAEFRTPCYEAAHKIIGNAPEQKAFLKNCGLDKRVPVTECLDRLDRLRRLVPGTLCVDKTWGFGVVRSVDPFYEKVVVDFDRKQGHELAMSYAAETLQILDAQHILAVNYADPEAMERLVQEDPARVVRLALSSYGPLSPVILQEKLSPSIVPDEQWKTFWDAARKALKKEPDAVMPSKRADPILLREAAAAFDDAWFRQLKHDRDLESIMQKISDWHALQQGTDIDPMHRAIIEDRLAFVIKGADLMGRTVMPRAMMLAHEISGAEDRMGVQTYVRTVLETDRLLQLLEAMSAKDMKAFVAFLMRVNREAMLQTLVRLLPRLDVTSLTEVLQLLIREGEEEACRNAINGLMAARSAEVEVLSWLSRNMDKLVEWKLCAPMEFAEVVLLEMEKDYAGARLRAQNQLRDRFTQKTWVRSLFDQLGEEGRERYFWRLKDTSAWPTMEKRSVLGHIIKLYPELERLMTTTKSGEKEETSAPSRGPVTSARTYRERQLLAERIKKVDIPNNSKEIAVARAHGDLRENFEYQAAKDAQGLLMRRQAELEQMLAKVVPTTFDAVPTDRVGLGTGVQIEYPDGNKDTYYILGVWDRDEALGIISSESKLAQALEGHGTGDEVPIPTESGEVVCRIGAVLELSDAVREWMNDVPESLEGRQVNA